MKVPLSGHGLQLLSSAKRIACSEVADGALKRVRGSLQPYGVAASDYFLYFRQTLRVVSQENANHFAKKATIAVNACQQRHFINLPVCSVRLRHRHSR